MGSNENIMLRSVKFCGGLFWCLFLFCCACRGAVRGWAELSSTEAAVTCSPAAGQHLLIKPCLPCCLLPDDFTSSMWYMAQVRSSFFMTSSLFCSLGDLTFSGVLSTTSVYQQADFQCLQLQPSSSPHLCSQLPCSVLTCVSIHHATTSADVSYHTSTSTHSEINKLPCNLLQASMSAFGPTLSQPRVTEMSGMHFHYCFRYN